MLKEIKSTNLDEPVIVIFGGCPVRRDEVLQLIQSIGIDITAHAVLSEEEGLQLLQTLPKLSLVLIGGRYTKDQRVRIKKILAEKWPDVSITEPGWEYPYSDEAIKAGILKKLPE